MRKEVQPWEWVVVVVCCVVALVVIWSWVWTGDPPISMLLAPGR